MIYLKIEGKELKQGLNVYSLTDKRSAGFILKVWRFVWRVRYGKFPKKWFITFHKIDPTAIQKLKEWEALHGIKHS